MSSSWSHSTAASSQLEQRWACLAYLVLQSEVRLKMNLITIIIIYIIYITSVRHDLNEKKSERSILKDVLSHSFIHSWISFIFIINANKGNENCENELTFSRHNVQCRSNGNQLRHGEFLERFVCLHVRSNNFGILQVFGKKSR